MPRLTRIEKSAFRKGEYVGYANGVWRVYKDLDRWYGIRKAPAAYASITARTLADLDAKLTQFAESA